MEPRRYSRANESGFKVRKQDDSGVNERSALLAPTSELSKVDESRDGDDAIERSALRELGHLAVKAAPVAASYALQNSVQTATIFIVGRLGQAELSAVAQSFMIAFLAWCVAIGGSTALDTLGSSLYTDGSDRRLLGILLQRCCFVLLILYIPFAVVFVFAEPILLALGQPPALAANVQVFLRTLAIFAPGYLWFESVKKFYQAAGLMHAATLVLLVTSPINIGLNWLFVHTFEWGLVGGAVATGITYCLSFVILAAAIPMTRARDCWGGFSPRAFKHGWDFAKLAIPGIFSVMSEWLAFEIVALGAGRLGEASLAAQSVIQTMDQLLTTLPFGQGVAASARLGNLLGAGKAKMAARSTQVSIWLSIIVGSAVLVVLLAARDIIGPIFTNEPSVIDAVAEVLIFVAVFQVADGIAQSTGGILRGVGRQHVSAGVNLIAYYVLALPIGFALAFKADLGLPGLWIGNALALYLVGLGQWIYVSRMDFETEARLALERNQFDHSAFAAAVDIDSSA